MFQRVPMQAQPNHSFSAVVTLKEENKKLTFRMTYNEQAQYWCVDLSVNDKEVITGLPLVPAQDILEQFKHLEIGSAYIIPNSEKENEWPNIADLADGWSVIWSD